MPENSPILSLIGYVVIMIERKRFGNGAPIADSLLCVVEWRGMVEKRGQASLGCALLVLFFATTFPCDGNSRPFNPLPVRSKTSSLTIMFPGKFMEKMI